MNPERDYDCMVVTQTRCLCSVCSPCMSYGPSWFIPFFLNAEGIVVPIEIVSAGGNTAYEGG